MKRLFQIFFCRLFRKTAAVTRLAAHSAVADIHGLHFQVLTQLQIFMETKSVCRAVMPHQLRAGALPHGPYRTGKAKGVLFIYPLHHAAAGETDKFRICVFKGHCQIFPKPMSPERFFRHQGGKTKGNRAGRITGEADSAFEIRAASG